MIEAAKKTQSQTPMSCFRLVLLLAASLSLLGGGGSLAESSTQAHLEMLHKASAAPGARSSDWLALGAALMQQNRNTAGHDFGKARRAFESALALAPTDPDALVGMAWVCNSEHDFGAGRKWAMKALAVKADHAHAHALLGDRAMELGDYEGAFEHLQDALDARADLSSYSRAGHLLWLTGDTRKARWLMNKAIAAGGPVPENAAWCRSEMAMMELKAGAILVAEQLASRAVKDAPNNPRTLMALAKVRMNQKRYAEAIQLCERSAAMQPNHEALSALVDLYTLVGRAEDAAMQTSLVLAFHQKPHRHSEVDQPHHHEEGNAQLAAFLADHDRDLKIALAEARKAYETSRSISTTDTLAWCLLKNGHAKEAARVMGRILKWRTPDPRISYHAGMIHAELGKETLARKFLSRALTLNANFDPVHAPRARKALE